MSDKMMIPLISVGELNHYVKGLLDRDIILGQIRIRGEVSNLTPPRLGAYILFTQGPRGADTLRDVSQ